MIQVIIATHSNLIEIKKARLQSFNLNNIEVDFNQLRIRMQLLEKRETF